MYKVIQSITQFLTSQATFIKRNRIIRYSGMTASFVLFVLAILTAFPIVIKDNETIAAAPKASDTVLAMTTGSENAAVDITVSSASGTFASSDSTKTAKFGVTTNNYTGYTLTIAGTDDTGLLTNTDTSITTNNTLSSISSATSADTFSSSTALNGKWGYQPSKYGSSTNTSFLPAPTTTASILDATGTANPTTPNNYTIGVGARVDYSKPAGTYANTFVLAVVGNPVPYTVNYNDNTGDMSVTNMPSSTSGNSSFTNVIISNIIPRRNGYTFKDWCSSPTTNSGTVCPNGATEHVAGSSLNFIDQTASSNIINLYAVWDISVDELFEDLEDGNLSMQKMGRLDATAKTELMSKMNDGTSYNSDDERDDQTYTISKINGSVWMTKNLAIGCDGDSVDPKLLSGFDSNISNGWGTPSDLLRDHSMSDGDGYDVAAIECSSTYGAWYNYAAASAGTITGENNDNPQKYDICPKGWRLPTEAEFAGITSSLAAFRPVVGGDWDNNVNWGDTTYGFWWGSTYGGNNVRSVLTYNNTLYTEYADIYIGNYVRCILNVPDIYQELRDGNLSMQEIGNLSKNDIKYLTSQMDTGLSYNSDDERDAQIYTIAKINNNLWMTRNLAIGCNGMGSSYSSSVKSTTLSSSDSNISGLWSTPTAGLNNGDSYDTPYMTCDSTYGAWYNYAAATAGTITGSNNSDTAIYDICPKGWRLPTENEITDLVGNNYNPYFNPVLGGAWSGGTQIYAGDYGSWWGSSSVMVGPYAWLRSALIYDSDSHKLLVSDGDSGDSGLYVRCIISSDATISDVENMEDVTPSIVDNTPDGATATLTDSRDNQSYTVAKINGDVWMTRNLAIGCNGTGTTYGNSVSSKTLTGETSNVSSSWSTPTALLSAASYSTRTADFTNARMQCDSTYGAWYNYAAATAGTIVGEDNASSQRYDICPKGWRLPTKTEITKLVNTSGSITSFNPVAGGVYNDGSQNATQYGEWWSAKTSNVMGWSSRANLHYDNTNNHPSLSYSDNGNLRYQGNYVRCILDTSHTSYEELESGDLTMQEMGTLSTEDKNSLISQMTNENSYDSTDERDGHVYTIAKINNRIWMTKNLSIGCRYDSVKTKTLTSADSNISSNWTTPTELLSDSYYSSDSGGYDTAAILCNTEYGAWYNYAAASAGTITGGDNENTQTYDICPKGWRLPTRDEFNNITNSVSAFKPVIGGEIDDGYPYREDYEGNWWGSSLGDSESRARLHFDVRIMSTDIEYRYTGNYVRCTLDNPSDPYQKLENGSLGMAEIGNLSQGDKDSLLSQMNEGASYSTTDERDGQIYTVTKINNSILMTRNLAIGCSGYGSGYGGTISPRSLTGSDSNISTNWTTPTAPLSNEDNSLSTSGYDTAAILCDNEHGAWYNYAAATAGTIVGHDNEDDAQYDICPKGWRLPTIDEFAEFISNENFGTYFNLDTSGFYSDGTNYNKSYGYWWSSTVSPYSPTQRSYLLYDPDSTAYYPLGYRIMEMGTRYYGLAVRCIKS